MSMSSISASFADRPPPDRARFLATLDEWRGGDVTAGTALQTLKRGGLDLLLGTETTAPAALREAWDAWERGKASAADTLAGLEEAGLPAFLQAGVAP